MGKVKEKTLRKLEDYFARETTMRGSDEVQVSLEDLRKETQLSLVTIYKAVDNLIDVGKLVVLEKGNRRSPKSYRYVPVYPSPKITLPSNDLAGITKALEELIHELTVKEQVIESLRIKLSHLEAQDNQVLYRLKVSEDTEVIVRKRIPL